MNFHAGNMFMVVLFYLLRFYNLLSRPSYSLLAVARGRRETRRNCYGSSASKKLNFILNNTLYNNVESVSQLLLCAKSVQLFQNKRRV
jgi:hypothetical protein